MLSSRKYGQSEDYGGGVSKSCPASVNSGGSVQVEREVKAELVNGLFQGPRWKMCRSAETSEHICKRYRNANKDQQP
jgi:hypothetical protein